MRQLPDRELCGGYTSFAEIFRRAPPLFFGSTSTISRFGERFRDGRYSLISFLFAVLLLTVRSPGPATCKSLRAYGVSATG